MINYDQVIAYLDAIMGLEKLDINQAPHGIWWRHPADGTPLTYQEFKTGTISGPGISPAVPILEPADPAVDKSESFFYHILCKSAQYKGAGRMYRQMPATGLYITSSAADSGTGDATDPTPGSILYSLANGTNVTGQQIQADLLAWLKGGAPQ